MPSSALRAATLATALFLVNVTPPTSAQQPPATLGTPVVTAPDTSSGPIPAVTRESPIASLAEGTPAQRPLFEPPGDRSLAGSDLGGGLNALGSSGAPGGQGGGMASMFSPVVGQARSRVSYGFTEYFDQRVPSQGTSFGLFRQSFAASSPIWQDDHNEWTASVNLREETFHTGGTILPNTGQPFPDNLWDVRFATGFRHLFDNGWIASANVSVGSASDQPFHSIHEMTAGVNASLRIPSGERNAWLFTLNYSATSEVNFPIPGIAFLYNPSDWFQAIIGFPFVHVNYRPTDDLTLSVSYALLTNFSARATYRAAPWIRVYGSFNVENESYFRVDRPDDRDRLFSYDDKLAVGVQFPFSPWLNLDVSTGYVFNHYYFEGRSRSDRNSNRINIDDGPFLGANLQFRF